MGETWLASGPSALLSCPVVHRLEWYLKFGTTDAQHHFDAKVHGAFIMCQALGLVFYSIIADIW